MSRCYPRPGRLPEAGPYRTKHQRREGRLFQRESLALDRPQLSQQFVEPVQFRQGIPDISGLVPSYPVIVAFPHYTEPQPNQAFTT